MNLTTISKRVGELSKTKMQHKPLFTKMVIIVSGELLETWRLVPGTYGRFERVRNDKA